MHAGWMALRTLSSDQSVKNAKLKPGTLKRIFAYAIPYKSVFALFLACLIADAVLTIATPLLLKELIDNGVIPKDRSVVTTMAIAVALLAIASALVNIVVRWISAKIGEGLIYDLRSQVFRHVQEQSIAFFTRTQTGALISRINSDVIGAQRAFTSTFSGIIKPNEHNFTSQEIIKVETISLNDVFKLLNLEEVTYLSIDTEGTEFEILNAFNFDKYRFRVITVEHNGDLEKALRIHKLLARNGYIRKFKYISGYSFCKFFGNLIPSFGNFSHKQSSS